MRKEVVTAIIFGLFLGFLITGGVWWFSGHSFSSLIQKDSSLSPTPTPPQVTNSPQPTLKPKGNIPLTIITPEDGEIFNDNEVELKGKTLPEAVVVLIYPEGENIVEADEKGEFVSQIELVGGANEIKVTAYDSEGNKEEEVLTVVYSTKFKI